MSDNFVAASDGSLEEFKISSPNGKELDITDLIVEFNIYEKLSSPLLMAEVLILDAAALLSNLPLMGQEKITGNIRRGDSVKTVEFYTTTVEDVKNVNDFTVQYTITLVEKAYYNNAVSLVSQAYTGPASEIITRIAEDYLDVEIDADQTDGNYSVVIPNWNPYTAINWMTKRAKNSNNVPCVCYNTFRNGLQLKSLETLFNGEPVDTYFYNKRNDDTRVTQIGNAATGRESVQTASTMYQTTVTPTAEIIQRGGYSSRTVLVDIRNKSHEVFDFNYDEYFPSGVSLASTKVLSDNFKINDKPVSQYPTTVQRMFYHGSQSFGQSVSDYNGTVLDNVPFRQSYMNTLTNFQWKLGIKGRTDIQVGNTINITMVKNMIADENNPDEIIDERRSGKHLVTALRHQFVKGSYKIMLDCVRNAMESEI